MTLEQLKEKVHALIRNGQTEAALEAVGAWADEHQQAQVKAEVTLLMADWTPLSREKRLGLVDNAEAARRVNQINDGILKLIESIKGEEDINTADRVPTQLWQIEGAFELLKYLMFSEGKKGMTKDFAEQNKLSNDDLGRLVKYLKKKELVSIISEMPRGWDYIEITTEGELNIKV